MFRTFIFIHHQELATILLNYPIGRIFPWFDVCWRFGVVGFEWYPCCRLKHNYNTDTTPTQPHRNANTHRTKNNTTNVLIQQNSRKLLMMDIFMSETCWAHKKWNKIASCASACNTDTTPTQPYRNSNTHRTKNNTTKLVIQQNSRKLLMRDILMSETCWAPKKWNKIACDIKLVFYSSTINIYIYIYIYIYTHTHTHTYDGRSGNKFTVYNTHILCSERTIQIQFYC